MNKRWEDHLKKMGNPFDLQYKVVRVEGRPCPAGYKVGDYFEYHHLDRKFWGNKGICLDCLPRLMESMIRIRGQEPHCGGDYITSEGERYGRVNCECGGEGGPMVWWTGRKIPREDMTGFYMGQKQIDALDEPIVYDIEARIVKLEGRGDVEADMCDFGNRAGDWICFDPVGGALTTSRKDGGTCPTAVAELLQYIMSMRYIPAWAKKDENGEPYLVYRCCTWADLVWEIRRVGKPKKGGLLAKSYFTPEGVKEWEKGRCLLIKDLNVPDFRYNP